MDDTPQFKPQRARPSRSLLGANYFEQQKKKLLLRGILEGTEEYKLRIAELITEHQRRKSRSLAWYYENKQKHNEGHKLRMQHDPLYRIRYQTMKAEAARKRRAKRTKQERAYEKTLLRAIDSKNLTAKWTPDYKEKVVRQRARDNRYAQIEYNMRECLWSDYHDNRRKGIVWFKKYFSDAVNGPIEQGFGGGNVFYAYPPLAQHPMRGKGHDAYKLLKGFNEQELLQTALPSDGQWLRESNPFTLKKK